MTTARERANDPGRGRRRSPLVLVGVFVLFGCPRASTSGSAPPDDRPAEAATSPDPRSEADAECGTPRPFAGYAWIPDDARLATSIRRDDPQLPAALEQLARVPDEISLPIHAALDYQNLALQLANLDRLLAALGLAPAELVELHGPGGAPVWLWTTDCPPATVAARLLDRFQIMLRADLERPGLRRGAGSAEGFPFDVVTLGDDRIGLTLVGHGDAIGVWLHGARGSDDGPGPALAAIEPAPIRSVLGGDAMMTTTSNPDAPTAGALRVTGAGWETVPSPTPD